MGFSPVLLSLVDTEVFWSKMNSMILWDSLLQNIHGRGQNPLKSKWGHRQGCIKKRWMAETETTHFRNEITSNCPAWHTWGVRWRWPRRSEACSGAAPPRRSSRLHPASSAEPLPCACPCRGAFRPWWCHGPMRAFQIWDCLLLWKVHTTQLFVHDLIPF